MDRTYRITLRGPFGEAILDVGQHQAILDAALRAGIDLPNSCCQGWCLTCAAKLLSGQVSHPHARRYYTKDAEAGFILPCTAEPRSDCVIETHQKEQMKQWRRMHGLPMPGG
jgi:ferredoxin